MRSRNRWILMGVVGLVAVWVFITLMQIMWLRPADALRQREATIESRIREYADAVSNADEMNAAIDGYISRTLGGTLEEVDHQLRSRLNRLGEAVGLRNQSVGTGRSVALLSPGKTDFKGATRRALREEVDFVEVEGMLSGVTDWPGVLELLDRINTAAWIKKIENVRVRAGGDGTSLQVSIRLRTLFIPNQAPQVELEGGWSDDRLLVLAPLAAASPFAIPPPSQPTQLVTTTAPSEPIALESPQWQLTGVMGIGDAAEVWIRNIKSGRSKRLGVGEGHAGLIFAAIVGDRAQFHSGADLVSIQVGQMLSDSTPVQK